MFNKFHGLFNTNTTINDVEVRIKIKPGCDPIQIKIDKNGTSSKGLT